MEAIMFKITASLIVFPNRMYPLAILLIINMAESIMPNNTEFLFCS